EGGWLGLFQIAGLRPEFQDALKGLVPGQVSPILKVNEEYLLLKLASEAETHAAFGCELAEQRKLDAAVSEFRQALRINPQYAQAHYNLGNALDDQGRPEAAAAEYREALRINPGLAQAHYNLGVALKRLGNVDEAIEEYHEALRLQPDLAQAHHALGKA